MLVGCKGDWGDGVFYMPNEIMRSFFCFGEGREC